MYRRVDRKPAIRLNVADKSLGEIDTGNIPRLKSGISFVCKQGVDATQLPIDHPEGLEAQPPRTGVGKREHAPTRKNERILSQIWFIQLLLETPMLISGRGEFANSPQEHGRSGCIEVGRIRGPKQARHFQGINRPLWRTPMRRAD